MNKVTFIERLNSLKLPIGEYYILSSGALLLYGLREEVGDIDLCVSEELFDVLKEKYKIDVTSKNECGFYKIDKDVEVVVNNKKDSKYKFEYDIVEGYPVQKLGVILRDKKKRNLPKDQKDIKNISEFLVRSFEICDLKNHQEFIKEIAILTQKEWGESGLSAEKFEEKVNKKVEKIKQSLTLKNYCKLILKHKNELIGFISIFPHDCNKRPNLTPWYATMFIKEEYRKLGYSKILNDAILKEAKARGFEKLYLKTTLDNYYEKFGAKYLETFDDGEKLLYFQI